jgi:ProP effector
VTQKERPADGDGRAELKADYKDKDEAPSKTNRRKQQWFARRRLGLDVLAVLSELFPLAFRPPTFRPLKLKIHLDSIERAPVTPEEVDAALSIHCRSLSYLRASTEGAVRVDLDGNPAGTVTAEEAAGAAANVARIRQRAKDRKAASAKPKEARQPPAASSGATPIAPKVAKPALRQPGRPIISLGGAWKGGAPS